MPTPIRLAARNAGSRVAAPPIRSRHCSPERSTSAIPEISASATTCALRERRTPRPASTVGPRHVRGQHQCRDAARRRHRGGDRLRHVGADVGNVLRRLHPAAQPAGEQLDVRVQRRVVLTVVCRVVADDVDDRCEGAARVVQAGQAVGEARPEVQQGCRRAARHATEPVGGAGDDALVQSQHGAHLGHLVERCDEVHLGRARIAEADVDAGGDQRPNQRLGAVHLELSLSIRRIPTT